MKQITRDEGTHSNYRLNDNYNDNHNNYNGKHYSDYYYTTRRSVKKRTAVYVGDTQTNKACVRQEGRSSENEREECREKERGYVWLSTREKFLPYQQVSYTVKTNVHTVSAFNSKTEMLHGGLCYKETMISCRRRTMQLLSLIHI